jgi:hypothetical protein
MTACRFYALTDETTAATLESEIARLQPGGLSVLRAAGLAAIVGPAPRAPLIGLSRKALAQQMIAFQQSLEGLMPFGPLLPAAFQAHFADRAMAEAFLIGHEKRLAGALRDFGAKRQFQVTVSWTPEAMLRRLAQDPALAETLSAKISESVSRGAAIQALMETYRAELSRTFEALLRAASLDCMILPGLDADAIVNATVLIEPERESLLDAAVEAIDAHASEALRIRMAGPLPACAFASIRLDMPPAETIARACRRLEVDRMALEPELKAAYHARMRASHPDVAPEGAAPDTEAKAAYELLAQLRAAELALQSSGKRASGPIPTMQLLRADMLSLVA